jgi:hypothetical protein
MTWQSLVIAVSMMAAVLPDSFADAQTRLYVLFPGSNLSCQTACSPSILLDVSVDERRILEQTAVTNAREWVSGPVVTADGRFVAWLGTERAGSGGTGSHLSAFEPATGTQWSLLDSAMPWLAGSLYADPRSLKLYGQLGGLPNGPIAVFEPHGVRTLPDPCHGTTLLSGVGLVGMSGNGARLLGVCSGPTLTPSGSVVLDHEGQSFYVASYSPYRQETELRSYEAANGRLQASRTIADRSAGESVYDPLSRRLFVTLFDPPHRTTTISALDAQSLATVGEITGPLADAVARVVPDPDNSLLYVLWYNVSSTTRRTRLAVYETIGFTLVADAELARYSDQAQMALAPRPPRVSGLAADVTGTAVTLRWTVDATRSMATGQVIAAGSGPGRDDIATLAVAAGQAELVVPDVPRGVYFVTVRAVNGTGRGQPSNEIVVTVP